MPRLAAIRIYPVKSLRGCEAKEAKVELRGLEHDRRFMVVDSEGGFLSQRQHPAMAQIDAWINREFLMLQWAGNSAGVKLRGEGPTVRARVWSSEVEAMHVKGADDLLSHVLKLDCRLVRMPDASVRPINPEASREGDHVSFADGFPMLLANRASLDDLCDRAKAEVPMDRFRPNLVIDEAEPWAEDFMPRLTIGDVPFRNVKPCIRCLVTTLDQRSGASRGPEPLATLATFRKMEKGVAFGSNLIPDAEGIVRVGDSVQSV